MRVFTSRAEPQTEFRFLTWIDTNFTSTISNDNTIVRCQFQTGYSMNRFLYRFYLTHQNRNAIRSFAYKMSPLLHKGLPFMLHRFTLTMHVSIVNVFWPAADYVFSLSIFMSSRQLLRWINICPPKGSACIPPPLATAHKSKSSFFDASGSAHPSSARVTDRIFAL